MNTYTEQDFKKTYKQANESDFVFGKAFYRMTPTGDGKYRAEAVKLTGVLSKDATKFGDLARRGQVFVATSKSPKSLRSTAKAEQPYKTPSTDELTSPLRKASRRATTDEKAENIKKQMSSKK